jgi:hypothetical protein
MGVVFFFIRKATEWIACTPEDLFLLAKITYMMKRERAMERGGVTIRGYIASVTSGLVN